MEEKEIEELKYQLAKETMFNFFAGNHSIVFDNDKERKEFFEFIKYYDNRYKNTKKFTKLKEVKEVAWVYCFSGHRHQLEFAGQLEYERFGEKYFYKTHGQLVGYEPIEYKVVQPYVSMHIECRKKIVPFLDDIENAIKMFATDNIFKEFDNENH